MSSSLQCFQVWKTMCSYTFNSDGQKRSPIVLSSWTPFKGRPSLSQSHTFQTLFTAFKRDSGTIFSGNISFDELGSFSLFFFKFKKRLEEIYMLPACRLRQQHGGIFFNWRATISHRSNVKSSKYIHIMKISKVWRESAKYEVRRKSSNVQRTHPDTDEPYTRLKEDLLQQHTLTKYLREMGG